MPKVYSNGCVRGALLSSTFLLFALAPLSRATTSYQATSESAPASSGSPSLSSDADTTGWINDGGVAQDDSSPFAATAAADAPSIPSDAGSSDVAYTATADSAPIAPSITNLGVPEPGTSALIGLGLLAIPLANKLRTRRR